MADWGGIETEKYINLETFKRDGTGVRTPVWFAADNGTLFVYAQADSGKVKRIRRDGAVRIAACDMRGKITGDWRDAEARLVSGEDVARGMALLGRKYWPWKQIGDFFARLRSPHPRAVIAITPKE